MVELRLSKGRSQLSPVNDRSFKHSIKVEQNCGQCGLKICYDLVAARGLRLPSPVLINGNDRYTFDQDM
jgi:hypothetical protein